VTSTISPLRLRIICGAACWAVRMWETSDCRRAATAPSVGLHRRCCSRVYRGGHAREPRVRRPPPLLFPRRDRSERAMAEPPAELIISAVSSMVSGRLYEERLPRTLRPVQYTVAPAPPSARAMPRPCAARRASYDRYPAVSGFLPATGSVRELAASGVCLGRPAGS
jgi:hypothetical protein